MFRECCKCLEDDDISCLFSVKTPLNFWHCFLLYSDSSTSLRAEHNTTFVMDKLRQGNASKLLIKAVSLDMKHSRNNILPKQGYFLPAHTLRKYKMTSAEYVYLTSGAGIPTTMQSNCTLDPSGTSLLFSF